VPDLTTPTTRAERRAAVAAWRAVPVRQRFAVVRSAKRGVRHPDGGAATAAEAYARVVLAPRGGHWWQRQMPRASVAVLLGCALALGLLSGWLFRLEGGGSTGGWATAAMATGYLAWGALIWDIARDCRRILSVAPTGHGFDRGADQAPSSAP
jgi:hypothetical protein